MDSLQLLTFMALIGLSIDTWLEMLRIRRDKSSREISLVGSFIRLTAIIMIFIKFLTIDDHLLAGAQAIGVISYLIYISVVIKYRAYRPIKKKRR